MFEFPSREVGLLLAIASWAVALFGLYISRKMNGTAPPALKYGMAAVFLYATLRLYSASSFVWGEAVSEAGLFPPLRLAVLVMQTVILILLITLVVFYLRRLLRQRAAR